MNSKQDILNAFREMRRLNGYASIWKYHPMGVARDIDKWLLNALTEFEREIIKEIKKRINKQKMPPYTRHQKDMFRELLNELEKEKHT